MVSKLPKFNRSVPAAEPMVAGHLATVAAEIADEFPLVLDHTSLVLLDLDPSHLHAFWTLAPADLHRAGAVFRAGGGTPELVIQLRRLRADGGVEVLARLPLAEGSRGDARFDLDNDDATYQAEIGLSTSDGGWLLLARSNHARLPRPVGVPIPVWDGEEAPLPARWVLAAASGAFTLAGDGEPPAGPEGLYPWVEPGLPGPDADPAAGSAPISLAFKDHEPRFLAPPNELPLGHLSWPEPSPMARPEPPGPISSFAVGRGPGAPVIEAEVLVHISAMPGTQMDLYGRPVRVGPSGRTTLRLPVIDLTLLSALLDPSAESEEGTGGA